MQYKIGHSYRIVKNLLEEQEEVEEDPAEDPDEEGEDAIEEEWDEVDHSLWRKMRTI